MASYMEVKRNYPLILSSSLWLIPGTYVLFYKQSAFSSVITYTITATSMNYWWNPTVSNLFYDQVTSHIGCFFYLTNSMLFLPGIPLKGLALGSVVTYYLVYRHSCHLHQCNNENWVYCHILFHLLVFSSKWILYLHL